MGQRAFGHRKIAPARASVRYMTIADRIDNTKDKLKGKGNQAAGELRGDERQKMRGHGQEIKGDVKDLGTDVKEALK